MKDTFDVMEQVEALLKMLTDVKRLLQTLKIENASYFGVTRFSKSDIATPYLCVPPEQFPWKKLEVEASVSGLGSKKISFKAHVADLLRLSTDVPFDDLAKLKLPLKLRRQISELIITEVEDFVRIYKNKSAEWTRWRMQEPSLQRAIAIAKSLVKNQTP